MTLDEIKLIQKSFKNVLPIADVASDIFYDRLFEIAPELRALFPKEMAEQKKKLMTTLAAAVQGLSEIEKVVPLLKQLGVRHTDYGVKESHYPIVGQALLYTLETGLGENWTPDVQKAWTKLYTTISSVMINAARSASASAA